MSRTLTSLAFAILAGTVVAAPVPKRADPVLYFPTAVGARWVYDRGDREETVEVSAVEREDGEVVVSRTGTDGAASGYSKTFVGPTGLRQDQYGGRTSTVVVLRTDLKPGESWETPEGKRTVHGPERVEVPAGKFEALRVEWEQDGSRMVSWYAPGVGEVKRVERSGGEETVFRVLKSFKPGK